MSRIFLDDRAQREFARDGFTVARLLSADEVAAVRASVDRLSAGRSPATENRDPSGLYVSFQDSDLDYRREVYRYLRDFVSPRLDRILADYRVLTATVVEKPAGEGDMELHRDWWMSADPADMNLIVWCPLVDTDEGNGTIRLVVGSQRVTGDISAAHASKYFAGYGEELKRRARPIPLRAGEALLFDATMAHWSPENRSAESRPALSLMCLPKAAVPAFYTARNSAEGPMLELFDMSGDAYYEHDMADLMAGTIRAKSLGLVKNPNRSITLEEFDRRVAAAQARRSGLRPTHAAARWSERVRTALGRLRSARSRLG